MLIRSLCIVALAVTFALPGPAADAGGRWNRTDAQSYGSARIKDCTRVNGRYGYYGNMFCTPAEQERFDRWSASRRWVR